MKCNDLKNALIWIQRVWNQPEGPADHKSQCVYCQNNNHFFFSTEHYAELQNIFLSKKKLWTTLRKHYATGIMVKPDLFSRREITSIFIGQGCIFREAPTKPTKEDKVHVHSWVTGRLSRPSWDLNWKFQWDCTALILVFSNWATPTNILPIIFSKQSMSELYWRRTEHTFKHENLKCFPCLHPPLSEQKGLEMSCCTEHQGSFAQHLVQPTFNNNLVAQVPPPSSFVVATVTVQAPRISNVQNYLIRA